MNHIQKNNPLDKTLTKTMLWVRKDEDFERVGYKWELNGKGLNQEPSDLGIPIYSGAKGNTSINAPEYMVTKEIFAKTKPNPKYHHHKYDSNGKWSIVGWESKRYFNGEPVIQVTDKLLPSGWKSVIQCGTAMDKTIGPYMDRHQLSKKERDQYNKKEMEVLDRITKEEALSDASTRPARHFLERRYSKRKNMNIVDFGPRCTTHVQKALLKEGSGNRYFGVDIFGAGLQKQRTFLAEEKNGYEYSHSYQIIGDFYQTPLASNSADIIVASASVPMDAFEKDFKKAINEVRRVLKTGGDFVLAGAFIEMDSPSSVSYLLKYFDVVDSYDKGMNRILVFRKK